MEELRPEPLWREVVGETEPWRRGRIILVLIAVLTLVNQAVLFAWMVLNGAIEVVLVFGIGAALFWLQFYLIWIGIHWVRWFVALCWGIWGFALLIWAFRDSNVFEMFSGSYSVVVAVCLGFVPSVYFFALRQRESKRIFEMVGVAVVVLMLIASLTLGIIGLSFYKIQAQREARSFADDAFQRIFTRHDTYFLLDAASDQLMKKEGRFRLTRFLQHETVYGGDIQNIQPANTVLWFSYTFPARIVAHAEVASEGKNSRGPIELRMRIQQPIKDWRIDTIGWFDPRSVRSAPDPGH
jgi:hypothetical protein